LSERFENECEKPGEDNDETYLKDEKGKRIIQRIFVLEGTVGGGLHGWWTCRIRSGHSDFGVWNGTQHL